MLQRLSARRLSLPITAGVLLVSLSVLATLQYRWLGQVAEAERAGLQAGARARVEEFAGAFDREITRAYAWLRLDADMLGADGGPRFAARYERWAVRTEFPGLVAAVYVAEPAEAGWRLRRFDAATRTIVEAAWPAPLEPLSRMLSATPGDPGGGERMGPGPPRGILGDEAPALVIPIPGAGMTMGREGPGERPPPGERGRFGPPPRGPLTVVALDRTFITGELLPVLAARHVAGSGDLDYAVVVTSRREPRAILYRSDTREEEHAADATTGLLEVHFDQVDRGTLRGGDPAAPAPMARWGPPRDGHRPPPREGRGPGSGPGPGMGMGGRGGPDHAAWEASVMHRGGSLEQVVAHVRRRNLAISFGILLLLGASAVMIVASSQRARRLADQQVEFVAGVSHELRTPVAVVCSAGENLADGLVRDPAEVRLYGVTIRDEGRRLAEMVEQVLEFAGITSKERVRAREPILLAAVVEDAVKASAAALASAGVEPTIDVPSGLPPVVGDGAALRRAVQNLVQNAARHAAAGRWIGISASAGRSGGGRVVRLTVRDRGPGITAADQERLFEPFFRGRQAIKAGVSGSGLGLSLVKRIAESHGGSVEMETAPGAGTAFTLVLPAAPASAAAAAPEEGHAQADPAR